MYDYQGLWNEMTSQRLLFDDEYTMVALHSGRTSVYHRQTFTVPRSACSWWVTTSVGKPSATGQPVGYSSLSSFWGR